MRRRTKAQPMAGAFDCSCASSAAYSAGSASGTVERNCATFMSGPFSPPRMVFRSSACADRLVLMPSARSPTTRAAMPPTAPEVRAKRRSSPKMLLPDMGVSQAVATPELPASQGAGEISPRVLTTTPPLPLREGAGGRGHGGTIDRPFPNHHPNSLNHPVEVGKHLLIGKPQHPQAPCPHPSVPGLVSRGVPMRHAIQFNDQPCPGAEKIRDERPDWGLAAESHTVHCAVAQPGPQALFSGG